MTVYYENETDVTFSFDPQKVAESVCERALDMEQCPYEVQVNLLLTDNEGIRELNNQMRGIDKETDVLSFPNLDYETESDFDIDEDHEADYFDPETGELILGDIMINVYRVMEQAESYGHSQMREFAFLVAHSMLHLCGYDHMTEAEAARMEEKQEAILQSLGITRDN